MSKRDIKINPDWEIRIKKALNGFETSNLEECDNGSYHIERNVFQDDTDIKYLEGLEDIEDVDSSDIPEDDIAMFNLLWHVKDYFGSNYNKYAKYNLVVKFEKNDEI